MPSQAIPDPLLPRVIEFIREFPVFLETVVHCARKTELALWPHLFSIVGNPKELFQQCLDSDKLSTAASYIIVLHNLEQKSISKQYATTLLNRATEKGEVSLVNDLVRFLNAIEPSELSTSTPTSKVAMNPVLPSSGIHTSKYLLSHSSLGTTQLSQEALHNQIMQLNLNKNPMIGRKRTQSSSASLMLHHSNSLESPHSIAAVTSSGGGGSTSTVSHQSYSGPSHSGQSHSGQSYSGQSHGGQSYSGQSYGGQLTNGTAGSSFNHTTTTLTNSTGLTTSTSSIASTSSGLGGSLGTQLNQLSQNSAALPTVPNHNPYFKNQQTRGARNGGSSIIPPGAVTLIQKNSNAAYVYKAGGGEQETADQKPMRNGSVNRTNSFNENDRSLGREQTRRHSIADASNSNCKLQ